MTGRQVTVLGSPKTLRGVESIPFEKNLRSQKKLNGFWALLKKKKKIETWTKLFGGHHGSIKGGKRCKIGDGSKGMLPREKKKTPSRPGHRRALPSNWGGDPPHPPPTPTTTDRK